MAVYREKDGDIVREYALEQQPILQYETERALVEIVPTKAYGIALFIDNELQFTEKDEYIYHEMLIHPCLGSAESLSNICIFGGGDGLAVREVLKWQGDPHRQMHSITVVDWDEKVTELFKNEYSHLNQDSLQSDLVRIENKNILDCDPYEERFYDCIVIDLVDPDIHSMYLWETVLDLSKQWVDRDGSIVINAGGILPWDIHILNTLLEQIKERFDWNIHLYKTFVPSFAREWCFILLNHTDSISVPFMPMDLSYFSHEAWIQSYTNGWTQDYLQSIDHNFEHQLVKNESVD